MVPFVFTLNYLHSHLLSSAQLRTTDSGKHSLTLPFLSIPKDTPQTELALSLSHHSPLPILSTSRTKPGCKYPFVSFHYQMVGKDAGSFMPVSLALAQQFSKYGPGTLRGPWDPLWGVHKVKTIFMKVLRLYLLSLSSFSREEFSRGCIRGITTESRKSSENSAVF